jgi:hypothetical protein
VSSDVLKDRLPKTIESIIHYSMSLYDSIINENDLVVKSYKDFIVLYEQKEKEGKRPRVYVSY